mmetsp:Transcript_31046/g.57367  ORF Transcript_31046/g.57367 Transcript_31046/m.57367 type:complete len:430 (-) Transcript_31046:19-1308(-)
MPCPVLLSLFQPSTHTPGGPTVVTTVVSHSGFATLSGLGLGVLVAEESVVEGLGGSGAGAALLGRDEATLGGNDGGLVLGAALLGEELGAAGLHGVRVELDEGTEVGERVLLVDVEALAVLLGAEDVLDLAGVDETAEVSVGHDRAGEAVVNLLGGVLLVRAVESVELLEGTLGPDDEAAEVSARGDLEEVQAVDVADLKTGEVAERAVDGEVLGVHDKRATAGDVAAVAHLALAGADLLGSGALLKLGTSAKAAQHSDGVAGLGEVLDVGQHQGDLLHLLNTVATGEHKRRHGGRGERGHKRIAALVHVGLTVPLAPRLGGGEHTAATAHVAEGTLARAVCAATTNTGDTRDGAAGAPGLGGRLVAGALVHGVSLALVLGNLGVDEVDDVSTDRGGEDSRQLGGASGLAGATIVHVHKGAGSSSHDDN